MERVQTGYIEDRKTMQQKSGSSDTEVQTRSGQGTVSRPEVPCSCPGCFPFDI